MRLTSAVPCCIACSGEGGDDGSGGGSGEGRER